MKRRCTEIFRSQLACFGVRTNPPDSSKDSDRVRSRQRVAGWRILTVTFVLAVVTHPRAQAADVFTPQHIAKTKSVSEVKISPDGQYIAYTIYVSRTPGKDKDGPPWVELHVVDQQGYSRPFVTGEVNVGEIDWTPDGRGICFLAKRGDDKKKKLYVIPVNGGEARAVAAHDESISGYTFAPDGKRVAFLAKPKKDKDIKKQEDKGFNAEIYEEQWEPTKVWLVTIDDEKPQPKPLDLDGSASELHFSPDGGRLAVALAPTSLIDDHYMRRKLFIVDAETGSVQAKIDNPGKLGSVVWSPDSEHVAVISAADLHDPSEGRLTVAGTSQDGSLRDLLPGYEGQIDSVAWQDRDTIMYVASEGVHTTFARISIDGNERKTVVPTGGPIFRNLSLTKDGKLAAFAVDHPTYPREVFAMAHGENQPRRLTFSNPFFDQMRFAKQEVVEYYARDGLKVEGLLIRPLDEVEGQRYPLIVTVHGGPEAHFSHGWITRYSDPGQVAAAKGFAVFYPNYRGSTGRGVAFSKLGQADYAGAEFNDLVDGVDHLVEVGLVDKKRVGVTGGSYGGYASAWCATALTEHFAASVMFVGIGDHVAKAGTTDIPHEMNLVHARKWPWEDWDFFRQRSPIHHAQKARTPILILHGKDDPRVHPSQSLQLHRYLKVIGQTPVRLVLYPGEGHGNQKAAARLDYNLRMMRWMEHYLKGPGGDPPPYELDYGIDFSGDDAEKDPADS